tara:strand:- start:38 stop:1723 length:1686 start_codon:yes stop_codon:yes gene_type:complete
MADEIRIELVADANGVIKAIEKTEPQAEKAGTKIGGAISSGIKTAGIGAAVGTALLSAAAVMAARKVGQVVLQGVEDAIVQAEAVNKLNNALATTGQFSQEASRDLQKFASDLQSVTRFGDEALIGQMAFAQSMGASAEQSKEIVKAATDMATALDIDLNSAVRNISKTLGGYAGELGEVIPELKGLTKEQLQAGEGVALLSSQFAQFAELSAKTFAGRLEQLQNSYGDLSEKVGESIVNNDFFMIAMDKARAVLDNFIKNADFSIVVDGLKKAALASVGLFESISKVALAFATVTGNKEIVKFFADTHAAAVGLKEGIQSITLADIERAKQDREAALAKRSSMVEEAKIQSMRNAQSEHELFLAEEKAKQNKAILENQKKELAGFKNTIKTQFVGGMVTAFSAFGSAMATGGSAFKDFGKQVLSTIGGLAIQLGQFFILVGAAMSATKVLMGLSGGAAIAAGIGLTVLGGALQGMAGGGGGGGAVATTSTGGGGIVESDASLVNTTGDVTGFNEPEAIERQQQVQLVVQGDVLDSEETGTRLLNILNEEFDSKGGRLAYA